VVLQIQVGANGVPISVRSLSGPYLLRATAEAYAMACRFFPPTQNGVPQAFDFMLTMPFNLTHTQ
jgi:hypothetical protein